MGDPRTPRTFGNECQGRTRKIKEDMMKTGLFLPSFWKGTFILGRQVTFCFSAGSAIQTCVTCTSKTLNRLQQPRLTSEGHRQWNWVLLEHSRGYFTEGEQRTKSSSHPGDEPLEDTLKIELIKIFTTHPLPLSKENCMLPSTSPSGRNLSLNFSIIHLKHTLSFPT